jgi:TonB family protein
MIRKPIVLSTMLHLMVIGILIVHFGHKHYVKTGNTPVMQAYIYQQPAVFKKTKVAVARRGGVKTKKYRQSKHGWLKLHKLEHKNLHNSYSQKAVYLQANLAGKENKLLMKLHDLIQEKITLPQNMRLFIKGRKIVVSFELLPNGNIDKVKIIKSSGIAVLDKSVVQAIYTITPVKFAGKWIQRKHVFELPILFKN